jgi:hypothetical protein
MTTLWVIKFWVRTLDKVGSDVARNGLINQTFAATSRFSMRVRYYLCFTVYTHKHDFASETT